MTPEEYSDLKENIKLAFEFEKHHEELFTRIKTLFEQEISSPSSFESITTIHELLNILEIRGVLSEQNIKPLNLILRNINEYKTSFSTILGNKYRTIDGKDRIIKEVINKVGHSWKQLGVSLGFRQSVINEIDFKYPSCQKKAMCLLAVYMAHADPDKWIFELFVAIYKIDRNDLLNDVKRLL